MFERCNHLLFNNKVVCLGFYTTIICLNLLILTVLITFKIKNIKDLIPISLTLTKIFHSLAMTIFNLFGSIILFIFCNSFNMELFNERNIFEFCFQLGISTQFTSPLILINGQYELILVLINPNFAKKLKKTTFYYYLCMIPYFFGFFITKVNYKYENHKIMYFGIGIGILGLFSTFILLYLLHYKNLIYFQLDFITEKKICFYILFSSTIVIIWFIPSLVIFMMHFESFSFLNINHNNDYYLFFIPIFSQFIVSLLNFVIVSSSLYLIN